MLTCHNLCSTRGDKVLFSHLGFSLQDGACLIILGPNGSGKTSLLKTIASILPPTQGAIIYNSTDITNNIDEYRYLINYIGHELTLDEELSVFENLTFYANIYGTHVILPAAIKTLGLEDVTCYPIRRLSQGMKRKVLLARLLLNQAQIWLLDEPFVNLDQEGVEIINNMISAKCSQGAIVILSTNQQIVLNTPLILNIEDYQNEQNSPSN